MKLYWFRYGMFDGRISLTKSDGLTAILSDRNFQRLRTLTKDDSGKYLWLPSEQLIALPHITTAEDNDGRTFVQNETFLIGIHDYLRLSDPNRLLSPFFNSERTEMLEPIIIKE